MTNKTETNKTEFKSNWNEQRAKLKQKFPNITDSDLLFEQGKKDEMLGRIQVKLGKTKEELYEILNAF
jgi:uncharacterized protein YjbJ (UPF0337 family)